MLENNYQNRIKSDTKKLTFLLKKISILTYIRLFTFLILLSFFALTIYYKNGAFLIGCIPPIFAFFIYVKRFIKLKTDKRFLEELIQVNKNEIKSLSLNFSHLNNGVSHQEPNHDYAHDMDLFGEKSLFQFLNRTTSFEGEQHLANHLSRFETNKSTILKRQAATKELKNKIDWRQNFYANGRIHQVKSKTKHNLKNWLENGVDSFSSNKLWTIILWGIPLLMLLPISLYAFGIISFYALLLVAFIPLAVTGKKLKLIQHHHTISNNFLSLFLKQSEQTNLIEKETFDSELLIEIQAKLKSTNTAASDEIKKLANIVQSLDNRSNPIFAFLMNALVLWDLQYTFKLKKWIETNREYVILWFESVYLMETYCSLGTYAYNNPAYIYPSINETKPFEAKNLGHPLISSNDRIDNSFELEQLQSFSIITGANMAGKSTFLRAVGVNLILGMSGAPVCATVFNFKPLKLFSSMRTADSLSENESYFYAELKRLKSLVDLLQNKEQVFVILDEILKGTNSKDKAEGSKKFVNMLIDYPLAGIIATHDLSLCTLGDEHPQQIKNNYFDVEIVNDELHFDYKLKNGVCSNMNAAYLMKKMGITK